MEDEEKMTLKERVEEFFNNNEKDLKKEIRRVKKELEKSKPGTVKYKQIREDYQELLDREEKLKKLHGDIKKGVLAGMAGIAGILVYRKLLEKTDDPWFRDLAKGILKIFNFS